MAVCRDVELAVGGNGDDDTDLGKLDGRRGHFGVTAMVRGKDWTGKPRPAPKKSRNLVWLSGNQ